MVLRQPGANHWILIIRGHSGKSSRFGGLWLENQVTFTRFFSLMTSTTQPVKTVYTVCIMCPVALEVLCHRK